MAMVACSTMTPLGALARGLLAGAAGTAAMDLYWYYWYKRDGGDNGLLEWEFTLDQTDWQEAPEPAQVGKRFYEGFFQRALPADRIALTNNVVHWAYGLVWGALYGLVAGSMGPPRLRSGLVFSVVVWTAGYLILPLANLYRPIWEYAAATLAEDLSAHLVYGVAAAATFRATAPPDVREIVRDGLGRGAPQRRRR
jgi:hypothetical protein